VLGVAAAGILTNDESERSGNFNDEIRWMSVLRSVSALQMYQRATHGPIDGKAVVRFLLAYGSFPRSVTGCFEEMRRVLDLLPAAGDVIAALDRAQDAAAAAHPDATEGAELDQAMETVQIAIGDLHRAIHVRYVDVVM
jgi:uncharacterized alpha-E superfamily protein